MNLLEAIAHHIGDATGLPFALQGKRSAGGGCINQATVLAGQDGRRYFVKLNDAHRLEMFEAEAAGLDEIVLSGAIRAPKPVCSGTASSQAYLVLEHLDLNGQGDDAELGRRLAALHRITQPRFGWWRDNTIGATHQPNAAMDDWLAFWRRHRLGHQLELARRGGAPRLLLAQGERLIDRLSDFFIGYQPVPSLLHGDLWGGNYGYVAGEPVLFDPAVYYGDREADLAMTELFGGFSARFYAAYNEAWPLDAGYALRKTLYNLYHVINHYNLFGGGYAGQAERMCARLLAETS